MLISFYERGNLKSEGKTKRGYEVVGHPELIWLEYKQDVTALDDPARTKKFEGKDTYSTLITCGLSEFLKLCGVCMAYIGQVSDTAYISERCIMYPLEVVVRNFPYGGFLDRFPEYRQPNGQPPERFDNPLVEFCVKTSGGMLTNEKGDIVLEGLNPLEGEEDPWVVNPLGHRWKLTHSHKKFEEGNILREISRNQIIPEGEERVYDIIKLVLSASPFLTQMWWGQFECQLIDIKFELGLNSKGELRIADGLSPDEFRLHNKDGQTLDKDLHRRGEDIQKVANAYALVASMVQKLRKQW